MINKTGNIDFGIVMDEEMSNGNVGLQLKQVIHATDLFKFDIEVREQLKIDPDYEISNIIYSGSFVIRGSGTAIVCSVGNRT
jgi:magnesium-transporting ATPase (P-type)